MEMVKTHLKIEEALHIFYARDFSYDILRRFFIEEPSREFLKHLVEQNIIELFPFKEESKAIQKGSNHVKRYFEEYNPCTNLQDYEDLHWDYTRMFIGPFEVPAPLWESVYFVKTNSCFKKLH